MNELEKLNCIALQYKWKLTSFNPYRAFLSNEIKFQNEASFRVGWNKKPMAYTAAGTGKSAKFQRDFRWIVLGYFIFLN